MVEVTLQTYCKEIESLIEKGAFEEAISHCQHILKAYPKYLAAYSLMGKTALEMGDMDAAADLFNRSLSMDPEDFVARVGMSIASDREGSLELAVWHMERAFELAPDNQAIVAELRRLYGRRDGEEPDKVRLTRGALARLHAKGNLYNQAINELRQLLDAEPNRIDLQVALAEALWRADRRIEAAEISLAVLDKLPYCLKGNLILGEIWTQSGREGEGAVHLERAQMIDPENETAQALFGERSPLPPSEVRIDRLEYVTPPTPIEQQPDWLQDLAEDEISALAADGGVPDWLQAVAASADVEAMPSPESETAEPAQLPEWLQDVTAIVDKEAEAFTSAPQTSAPAFAEGEMPDWLAELTAEPTIPAEESVAPEALEDWLEEAGIPPIEEPDAAPVETPDWLAELTVSEPEPEAVEEPGVAPDEMPDWLAELAATEEALADTEDVDLAPADIPEWLAEMAPPEAVSSSIPDLEMPPAEVPDWLAEESIPETGPPVEELAEEETETAPALPEAEETSDWLSELVEAAGVSIEEDVPADQLAEAGEESIPEWLAELREEPAVETVEPEIIEREALVEPEGAEVTDAEADLFARMEEMSPEEAFAAWEAMLAESEQVIPEEEVPTTEAVAEADEAGLVLEEDESTAEVVGLISEELLPAEPASEPGQEEVLVPEELIPDESLVELEQEEVDVVEEAVSIAPTAEAGPVWMTLAEDEVLEEAAVRPVVEEAELEVAEKADEAEVELPPLAEVEAAAPPEEATIEPPLRPTWVALEEEPTVEAVTEEVPAVEKELAEPEDDQGRLEQARRFWASGQMDKASKIYEDLLASPLLDDVVADLERITTTESPEEAFLRLLGDAYMKDNRLQEALTAYRRALASL